MPIVAPKSPSLSVRPKHVLSVDVEDYFQVEAFADCVSRTDWESLPSRVEINTFRLLDLFDRYETKATFFVVGWVAARFPRLVRRIQERGHELACHSYWHRKVYTLGAAEFRADTRMACTAIQQAAGVRVTGYRAPTWSINGGSLWAFDVLAEEGFTYDSSIYPVHHDLYGVPGASRSAHVLACKNGRQLIEFPPATTTLAGATLPVAGGGYLRLLPFWVTQKAFAEYDSRNESLVVYLHPWEIDPDQPRIKGSLKSRFRHYTNLHRMLPRLESLLQSYSFHSFRDHLEERSVVSPGLAPVSSATLQSRSAMNA